MSYEYDCRPASVYRCFNADGELLYVGCSVDVNQRVAIHRSQTPWFAEVADITSEPHPTRSQALDVEAAAILAEQPKYNQQHKRPQCAASGCANSVDAMGDHCAYHPNGRRHVPDLGEPSFSATEVVDMIPGLTYRMLDYWTRQGYVTPAIAAAGSGSRRRFTQGQVDHICSVIDIREQLNNGSLWKRVMRGEVVVRIEELAHV